MVDHHHGHAAVVDLFLIMKTQNTSAFTLLELLIVLAGIGIVVAAITYAR